MTEAELCAMSACFKEGLKSMWIIHVINSPTSCLFRVAGQAFSVKKITVMRPGELAELNTSQDL